MNVEILEPGGAVVTGVTIDRITPDTVDGLRTLLADHGVVVLPDQHVDDSVFVAFLSGFGDLTFTTGETAVTGFPDLNVVSNVGRTTTPRSTFHTDTSYVRDPPAYTALRAVDVPSHGGATLFTNQYRAYDTLPPDVRSILEGRTITHVVTGLDLDDDAETAAKHPALRPHPISGRTALFLSTPQRCVAVSELDSDESDRMIRFLFEHSTAPGNIIRHDWSPGDIVMWDNACVMHRADHSDVIGDRVMHRGMVASHHACE